MGDNARAVYSSEAGRIDDATARDGGSSRQGSQGSPSPGSPDGIVRVSRTKAGRKGKTVTLVTGLPPADLGDIARDLKRLCGSGGAVKDGVVEVQGDHRDKVAAHLGQRYRVKIAGG
ncbi:MAG: stress response translation initiation inhibitor YciH [Acidobacteria bacterium]|nr:stress response translation initiation inhibitor YciH [Acidobacteriota bacterium]